MACRGDLWFSSMGMWVFEYFKSLLNLSYNFLLRQYGDLTIEFLQYLHVPLHM
jgi:hypothetical protein